jgi:hypothetical protein
VNLAVAYADVFFALKKTAEKSERADKFFPWTAPVKELDGKVLERIYDTPFDPYVSDKGAKAWHVRTN